MWRELRSSVIVEEVPESDPNTLTDQFDSIIATLESRVNSPPVCTPIIFLTSLAIPHFVVALLRCQ